MFHLFHLVCKFPWLLCLARCLARVWGLRLLVCFVVVFVVGFSHRRLPHRTWKDVFSLTIDLLLGFGKRRYFNMARVWQRATSVNIKGFSAGSYVGLALVHVFREIKSVRTCSVLEAIACPPSFLQVPDERHRVHLIHYVPDKLCRWNPVQSFLEALRCKFTIVQGHFDLHQHHFGRDEHNYARWLNLQLEGEFFSAPPHDEI